MPEPGHQNQLLQKWLGFTQKIINTLDLDHSTKSILKVTLELTGTQKGFIQIENSDTLNGFFQGCDDQGTQLGVNDFSLRSSAIEAALGKKDVHFFLQQTPDLPGSISGFCVPILSSRSTQDPAKVIGFLYAESSDPAPFDGERKEIVHVITAHAAPALENAALYDSATRDPLTRLYLRHHFDSAGLIEWRRTLRHKHPISILTVDLDDFRLLNEENGREAGDDILQKTAGILKELSRAEDILCRYGGEEFCVLLPETDAAGARHVANRIQEESSRLIARDAPPGTNPVTLSIGIATHPRCSVARIQELFTLSETALQQAKQAGKNRIVAYEPSLSKAHEKLFH